MTMWVLHRRPDRRVSFKWIGALALILGGTSVAAVADTDISASPNTGSNPVSASTAANAAGVDQSKEQLIRALIKLTDTPEIQALFSQQLINRVSSAVSMFGPALNARTLGVIQQQTQAVVAEHIADGDALYSVLAPIYEKHFNLIELNQLVQFYQSPLGQKLVNTSPELLSETLDLGSQWGLSLVPEIVQRVRAQLNEQNPAAAGATAN